MRVSVIEISECDKYIIKIMESSEGNNTSTTTATVA